MTSVDDILEAIPSEKLPELKEIYKKNWPNSVHVYYFIDTIIQWKVAKPNENLFTIYSPGGDFTDGTIIAIIETECYDVFIYTLEPSMIKLEKALKETKMIKWEKVPLLSAVHSDFFETVVKVSRELGHPVINDNPSNVWWLPKKKALEYSYSIPDNIYVAPLNESHVETMNAVWPHRAPGTEKYLAKVLELNGGMGIFLKSNDELCSWIIKNYFGGLGVLQTAEKHKRKGFATLLTKVFSKFLAEEEGYDLTCFIVRKNSVSQSMFTKLGYEKIVPVTWCEY